MSPSSTFNGPDQSPVQETTPLLASPAGKTNQEPLVGNASDTNVDNRPLPKAQIFVLCYARLVEPIAFFSIFPFVNQMIWETSHLNEADVGFYSGLIVRLYAPVNDNEHGGFSDVPPQESLFSLTQMLVMISWGRAADRFGRKPILVMSLVGVTMATSIFGLSKAVWQMIAFRCLAGVFAGTVV